MFEDWFLDYASYVNLDRAVPNIYDGLKPVQRRILHSMWELEDGRYNKVANIVGNTMKYHPHGDASINDALVNLGQKELLIDCQGNWKHLNRRRGGSRSLYRSKIIKICQRSSFSTRKPRNGNFLTTEETKNLLPFPLSFFAISTRSRRNRRRFSL